MNNPLTTEHGYWAGINAAVDHFDTELSACVDDDLHDRCNIVLDALVSLKAAMRRKVARPWEDYS